MGMMATYTKLKSGDWGIKIVGGGALREGVQVQVRKKSGDLKYETIAKILWRGPDGTLLCAISQRSGSGSGYTSRTGSSTTASSGTCPNCGGKIYGRGVVRRDSSGIAAPVCSRCARDGDMDLSFA